MSHFVIIAIDGGAASGKSSTSRALAERFNLLHVDTGAFYRTLTAELLRQGIRADDADSIRSALGSLRFGTRVEGHRTRMEVGGRVPPESEIRGPAVTGAVPHVAAIPEVRAALLSYQRMQADIAREKGFRGIVMEGRDIGSVIFPDADFRFFLHADPEARARRRALEGRAESIGSRDLLDASRKTAPLACPEGATSVDSTHLTLEEVVGRLAEIIATALHD